jgi:hypothetical protein
VVPLVQMVNYIKFIQIKNYLRDLNFFIENRSVKILSYFGYRK